MLDSLHEYLDPHPIVGQVRGQGMWLAVDFAADKETRAPFEDDTVRAVVRRMRDLAVIASPIGTAFELAPPLIATKADIDETVRVAAQAIDEVARERQLM
jgi:L-2,4-diaminobutyrate transaminase